MKEYLNKFGIDLRTKISTLIAIGAYLNMMLATFDPSIIADNPTAMRIYQIVSAVLAFCAWVNSHYYNQNYSPEAMVATIKLRDAKKKRMAEQELVEEPEDSYIEEEEVVADEV